MNKIITLLNQKPALYKQGTHHLWKNPHIAKGMLKAHLDEHIDSATRRLESVKTSAKWISKIVPPSQYPTLLDLGCGPGIYAELFHTLGYRVTGLDISENAIRYARNSAAQKKYQITYSCDNYVTTKIEHTYHIITLIYCDFGVLATSDRITLLKKIYDALLSGGTFIFDVFTSLKYKDKQEYKEWEYSDEGFWYEKPHVNLHAFYRYDEENTYLNRHVILSEEEICVYNIWEHTFTKEELIKDLQEAGFHDITFYQSITGGTCQNDDETICVVAKKL